MEAAPLGCISAELIHCQRSQARAGHSVVFSFSLRNNSSFQPTSEQQDQQQQPTQHNTASALNKPSDTPPHSSYNCTNCVPSVVVVVKRIMNVWARSSLSPSLLTYPHLPAFPHLFSAQINPFLAVLSTPHHSGRTTDKIQYKYKLQPPAAEKHITGNKSVVSVGRREKSPPFLATECGVNKC